MTTPTTVTALSGATLDPGMGHWLAGFIDGEGNFDIHRQARKSGEYYYCRFEIGLRADDRPILEELCALLGGRIYDQATSKVPGANPKSRWELVSRADCWRLVSVLDTYPMRAKKARDYIIWRAALTTSTEHAGRACPDEMRPHWEQLRALRPFTPVAVSA